ncbi:MAG: hypothetical protein ACOYJK_00525 [Prevotella sp.]|jgi:cell division septum initiation protein DivIVA
MFGNNKNMVSQEQLDELLAPIIARIDKLETASKQQARQIAELERQLNEVQQGASGIGNALAHPDGTTDEDAVSVGVTLQMPVNSEAHPSPDTKTLFFPAPSPDGTFMEGSLSEQVGKSIYQLQTEDDINGKFVMLSTPDAIATAMISVSQFVKPACKVDGNTHQPPKHIENIEEGIAKRDGTVWRVVRKARVAFQ